jgi:acetolactate synthase-1/2/3 large subunit
VVIALPEDMLTERVSVADAPYVEAVETSPGAAEMAKLQKMLDEAKAPFIIVGGSRWSQAACDSLERFAQKFAIPVVTTFRRGSMYDSSKPTYAGDLGIGPNPKMMARLKASDLVLLIGGRLGEMPSQSYTLFDIPTPQVKFVHVHPGSEELGRVYHPTLAINASPGAFAAAAEKLTAPKSIPWKAATEQVRADYIAWTEKATPQPGGVNLGEIMVWLRDELGPDGIITNGAGNYSGWIHRFYRFQKFGTLVGPTSGSMGYGVPAAVAMKHLHKDRPVVCIAGDGDFLMTGQEFATAVQYNLPIIVVVSDNGIYGTIVMHQEREYPGRIIGTRIRNPDFVAYATAFGGYGALVEKTADFPAAFAGALQSGKPSIIHLKVDPNAITTATTLDAIRDKALASGKTK